MSDTLSDMLARIRNGQMAKLYSVKVIYSKLNLSVLDLLKEEGYISDHSIIKNENNHNEINVSLKYQDGKAVIKKMKRISTPGRRVYCKYNKIPKPYNGLGLSILTTSRGVVTDGKARQEKIGGEILCTIF